MKVIDADALKKALSRIIITDMRNYSDRKIVFDTLTKLNNTITQILDEASAIELYPQWIPFTWRKTTEEDGWDPEEFPLMACGQLPNNGQDILVTDGRYVWSDTFFDDNGLYLDSGNDLVEDVTAWMPLPKPYKPEKIEDWEGYYYVCVDAGEPMQFSGQPLPKCRLEET